MIRGWVSTETSTHVGASIVLEWQETGPQIDGMVDSFGPIGEGDPDATLRASRFEVLRALSGRRSVIPTRSSRCSHPVRSRSRRAMSPSSQPKRPKAAATEGTMLGSI